MIKTARYVCMYMHTRFYACLSSESQSTNVDASKSWELKFLRSPVECLESSDGRVKGVRFEVNQLEVHVYNTL